jgi:hypothetical protein
MDTQLASLVAVTKALALRGGLIFCVDIRNPEFDI